MLAMQLQVFPIHVSGVISKRRLVLDREFIIWHLDSRGSAERNIDFASAQQASHKDGILFFTLSLDHSTIVREPSSTGITAISHQKGQGAQHASFCLPLVI